MRCLSGHRLNIDFWPSRGNFGCAYSWVGSEAGNKVTREPTLQHKLETSDEPVIRSSLGSTAFSASGSPVVLLLAAAGTSSFEKLFAQLSTKPAHAALHTADVGPREPGCDWDPSNCLGQTTHTPAWRPNAN